MLNVIAGALPRVQLRVKHAFVGIIIIAERVNQGSRQSNIHAALLRSLVDLVAVLHSGGCGILGCRCFFGGCLRRGSGVCGCFLRHGGFFRCGFGGCNAVGTTRNFLFAAALFARGKGTGHHKNGKDDTKRPFHRRIHSQYLHICHYVHYRTNRVWCQYLLHFLRGCGTLIYRILGLFSRWESKNESNTK